MVRLRSAVSPIVGEQLKCYYKINNCYDRHAIAETKRLRGRLAYSEEGLFVLKSSARTTEDLH